MSETPENPKSPKTPTPASGPDATDTAVQPVAEPAAPNAAAPNAAAPNAAAPSEPAPAVPVAKKDRFAWVSSPKVAAATVITVLALAGLGGAFALGRATAPDLDDRMLVRVPVGFEGRGGFDGPPGLESHERGPGMRHRFYEGEIEQIPPTPDQSPEVTPSPSQSS